MVFIGYTRCTTSNKAQAWLDAHGIAYTFRDIKTAHPTAEELSAWVQPGIYPLKRFFNTAGLLYKSMALKEKLPEMSESEQIALLATDGMLVKRPILLGEGFLLVGFREAEWAEKLLK